MFRLRCGLRRGDCSPWSHQAGRWGGVVKQGGGHFRRPSCSLIASNFCCFSTAEVSRLARSEAQLPMITELTSMPTSTTEIERIWADRRPRLASAPSG